MASNSPTNEARLDLVIEHSNQNIDGTRLAAPLTQWNSSTSYVDARHGDIRFVQGDMNTVNNTYISQTGMYIITSIGNGAYTMSAPDLHDASLTFIDAPIDLLSPHFMGRDAEQQLIKEALGAPSNGSPVRFAINAMPGAGKSQLALQYANLSFTQRRYAVIFWISATTIEKIHHGLLNILQLVHHPDRNHPDEAVRLTAARRWLEESSIKWLLVLDNANVDTVVFMRQHLPRKNPNGNILLTTRAKDAADAFVRSAGQNCLMLSLQALAIYDAARLLLRDAGIDTVETTPANMTTAEELVKCVGCLPLAVSHAASFMQQSGSSLEVVVKLYNSHRKADVSRSYYFGNIFHKLMVHKDDAMGERPHDI